LKRIEGLEDSGMMGLKRYRRVLDSERIMEDGVEDDGVEDRVGDGVGDWSKGLE
jgi:hypothetical protein